MRAIIQIRIGVLLLALLSYSLVSTAQCDITVGEEDVIRFQKKYRLEVDNDNSGTSLFELRNEFAVHFTHQGATLNGDEILKVADVRFLRDQAGSMSVDKYITAVQINYGLDGDRVVFIYEPGILTYAGDDGMFSRVYKFKSSKKRFYQQGGTLIQYDESTMRFMENYRNEICIIHLETDLSCTQYNAASDVTSVIVQVQEMLKEYCQNNGGGDMDDNGEITVYNISSSDPYDENLPDATAIYKHHIALQSGTSTAHHLVHVFTGYAADFTEMCPPRCSEHIYKIKHALWENILELFD